VTGSAASTVAPRPGSVPQMGPAHSGVWVLRRLVLTLDVPAPVLRQPAPADLPARAAAP